MATTQLRGSQILDGTITSNDIDDSLEKEFTKVRTTVDDSTPAFLSSKISAGSGISLSVSGVSGSNQTLLITSTGATGPQGPQGLQGEQGIQGPTGPQGLQGAQGPQGTTGLTGDTGATGPTGAQGVQGVAGPQGLAGLTGDTGATGPTGSQGTQGIKGDTGAAGAQGLQGAQGDIGPTGPTGAQGAQGVAGPAGPAGSQGPQGIKGDTGIAGPQGAMGDTGPTGPTGAQGAVGTQGPQGLQGIQGQQGLQGSQGPQGLQGDSFFTSPSAGISSTTGSLVVVNNLTVSGSTFVGNASTDRLFVTASSFLSQTLTLEKAGSTTLGASQLYINGATSNRIDFTGTGLGAPSVSRSAGTKLVLWPGTVGSTVDYALGMDSSTFWFSLGNSSDSFKWYAGTTNIATINGSGLFSAAGNISSTDGSNSTVMQNNGAVEITSTTGVALIDFKTSVAEDYDCRIIQNSNGLQFETGGQGAAAVGLTIDSSRNVTIGGDLRVNGNDIQDSTGTTRLSLGTANGVTGVWINGDLRIGSNGIFDGGGTERITLPGSLSNTVTFTDATVLTSLGTFNATTATGTTLVVTSTGTIRRTSSSAKYKKDIENISPALVGNAIENLRPVWYRSKNPEGDDKPEWSHIGLIAEEVHTVEPRLVRYRTVSVTKDEEGNRIETPLVIPEPEDVDYARLSVLLLAEVKAQKELIAQLTQRIITLEQK